MLYTFIYQHPVRNKYNKQLSNYVSKTSFNRKLTTFPTRANNMKGTWHGWIKTRKKNIAEKHFSTNNCIV